MARRRKRVHSQCSSPGIEADTHSLSSASDETPAPAPPAVRQNDRKSKFELRYETATKTPEEVLGMFGIIFIFHSTHILP